MFWKKKREDVVIEANVNIPTPEEFPSLVEARKEREQKLSEDRAKWILERIESALRDGELIAYGAGTHDELTRSIVNSTLEKQGWKVFRWDAGYYRDNVEVQAIR